MFLDNPGMNTYTRTKPLDDFLKILFLTKTQLNSEPDLHQNIPLGI